MKQKHISGWLCAALVSLSTTAFAQGQSSAAASISASAPVPAKTAEKSSALAKGAPADLIADESVTPANVKSRYPAKSIDSVEHAERALGDVKRGRARIEAVYKADEKACYKTFFANRCVSEARDRRRMALAELKPIQVEADAFKRHDVVVKRDKALEENRQKEAATIRPEGDARKDAFEARQEQTQQKDATAAGKRAENEAAFAKRAKEREAAQRKVAERRARTERRRKAKAASAAAAAARRQQLSAPSASSGTSVAK